MIGYLITPLGTKNNPRIISGTKTQSRIIFFTIDYEACGGAQNDKKNRSQSSIGNGVEPSSIHPPGVGIHRKMVYGSELFVNKGSF